MRLRAPAQFVAAVSVFVVCGGAGTGVAQSGLVPLQPPDRIDAVAAIPSAAAAGGQVVTKPDPAPPTPRHTGIKATLRNIVTDFTNLPSRQNLFWVALGGGLSLAVHPIDDDVNRHLAGKGWVHDMYLPGKILGQGPTQIGTAFAVYAIGRRLDNPKVSHLGMDFLRAQALTQTMTYALKYSTRRTRPDGTGYSFPSGHASTTFATATVLERHLGWKGAVPAYLISSYVASSRLHENRHFLSDVVFGAAVGIIGGRTATRHGGESYTILPVPVPGGAAVVVMKMSPE